MVQQIDHNIFKIEVPLPNNPLRYLNSYFIRGEERDLLIDTGFRLDECREALKAGLAELHSDPEKRDVLVTHFHADHSGLADEFVGDGCAVYLGKADFDYIKNAKKNNADFRRERFILEGFPEEEYNRMTAVSPMRLTKIIDSEKPKKFLNDGDVIRVGEYDIKALLMPGHTPGNLMLWVEEKGIMFTGDHILFDITPNITAWPGMENSLGKYLDGLEKAKTYPVRRSLPAHRKEGDYLARIEELLQHHDIRLREVRDVVLKDPGLTAYEISGKVTWKLRARSWEDFPLSQKSFAVGECLSHLDYLLDKKTVRKELEGGVYKYYP